MSAAIRVENLSVEAASISILNDLSFTIVPGTIVALVGSNGAGKTTLLDAMSGMVPVRSGRIVQVGDEDEVGRGSLSVGRVFQGSELPATLTVEELASLAADGWEEAELLLRSFGLADHRSTFVSELSTGMRRILDLACATTGNPSILLLDEPSSGLAQGEIQHLAQLIKRWRDASKGTVLLVEHDLSLVKAVADEVIVMEAGRMIARGAPDLLSVPRAMPEHPAEPVLFEAVDQMSRPPRPSDGSTGRSISTWTLLRLGLREFAAGLSSVLILGVLNRVMKVEMGISLGLVAAVLASYNLAAPVGLFVGHLSDRRPFLGARRVPYIIGGALLTGFAVAASPHVAALLGRDVSTLSIAASVLLFGLMGVGMYSSGSVFFALLADKTNPADRGRASSIIYVELLAGILAGVALVGVTVNDRAEGLTSLFGIAGILVVAFTALATWGQEDQPAGTGPAREDVASFRDSFRTLVSLRDVRRFFVFMLAATFFVFLHQAVLEPYGGDILGLGVRQTGAFNGVMAVGTMIGLLVAGRPSATRFGYKGIGVAGLGICSSATFVLAVAAGLAAGPLTWLAIFVLGAGTGVFTVGALAMMMGMSIPGKAALSMGVWTMAHALADGGATAGGGAIFESLRAVVASESSAYAGMFAVEAVGLAACIALLRRVDTDDLNAELPVKDG